MPLNIEAEIEENTTCNCWRDTCSRDTCPCMNIDCADVGVPHNDCGGVRGCVAGDCACLASGECD